VGGLWEVGGERTRSRSSKRGGWERNAKFVPGLKKKNRDYFQ